MECWWCSALFPGSAVAQQKAVLAPGDDSGVVITSDFVGVRSVNYMTRGPADTITWVGDASTGKPVVIWAAFPPTDLRDANGNRTQPRFIGRLTTTQVDDVRAMLAGPDAFTSSSLGRRSRTV